MPSESKSNLALDVQVTPFTSMTLEAALSWTNRDIHYVHQHLKEFVSFATGTSELADGRNLIKDTWGLEKRVVGGNVPIINVTTTANRDREPIYAYYPDPDNFSGERWYQSRTFSSRWAAQVGIRYSF